MLWVNFAIPSCGKGGTWASAARLHWSSLRRRLPMEAFGCCAVVSSCEKAARGNRGNRDSYRDPQMDPQMDPFRDP